MNSFMDKVFKEVDAKESCNNINYSNQLHKALSHYVANLKKLETKVLVDAGFEIIMVLNRLSFYHFCKVMNDIDTRYPGLSFHLVMEARHNNKNQHNVAEKIEVTNLTRYQNVVYLPHDITESIDRNVLPKKESQDFLNRLIFLRDINCLSHLFAPMRVRLVSGLLDEEDKESCAPISQEKIALHNYFKWINKDENISHEFKSETEDIMNMYLARDVIENYQPTAPRVWTEEQFMIFLKDSIIYNSVQEEN